jgi:hypothetical protein
MGSEGLHLHHPQSDVQHGGDKLFGVSYKLNYSTHASAASTSSAIAGGSDKPQVIGAPRTARLT